MKIFNCQFFSYENGSFGKFEKFSLLVGVRDQVDKATSNISSIQVQILLKDMSAPKIMSIMYFHTYTQKLIFSSYLAFLTQTPRVV